MAAPETLDLVYGYVYGRFVTIGVDTTADPDDKPDAKAASGTVTFTPLAPVIQTETPGLGVIGVQNPMTYTLDSTGTLRDDSDQSPVALPAADYRVSFKIDGANALTSIPITVTGEHTKESPLNLRKVYPLQPTTLTKFVVNQQVYDDAIAAQEAAAQSAIDAAASADEATSTVSAMIVSGAVQGDDLILTAKSGATTDAGNVRGPAGRVQQIVAGANVTVDDSDPTKPVVSAAGGGGAVDSVNGLTGDVSLTADDVGAYAKPVDGIPGADLSSGVQGSLGKADTAVQPDGIMGLYTKPAAGIPAADLDNAVQASLGSADSAVQPADLAGVYTRPAGGIPGTDLTPAVQASLADADSAVQPDDITGLYSKPVDGIPGTDLAADVRASLGRADTALQAQEPVAAADITDATSTGRSVLTASSASNARTAIGAGTSNVVIGAGAGQAADAAATTSALSGKVSAVIAGANVTVDNTDPTRPVVSAAGGGDAVSSVNGKVGDVTLTASDVEAATRNAAVFNVRDYGAKGDGATDDTAAIQAAATALRAVTSGVLYFPAGTYKLTSTIALTPTTVNADQRSLTYAVRGDGSAATIILYTGSGPCLKVTDPNYDASQATLGAPIWQGFAIDGTGAAAGASGIQFGDVSGGKFVDIRVGNFVGAASAGILFQNTTGWTEKVHTRDVHVGNCTSLLKFRNSGPYASWMYWDVDFDLYPFLNQIAIDDDPTQSTHDGSRWHVTANSACGDGNTAIFLNLPANNSWWSITWDFAGEVYGSGPAIKTINMTTAAKFFGFGKFHAYFMGASTIPAPLGWYFSFYGTLALPGVTSPNGEEDLSVLGPVRRLVETQPSIGNGPTDYPATIAKGVAFQNTTGSDVLVTVMLSVSSGSTALFAGPQTTPPPAPTDTSTEIAYVDASLGSTFAHLPFTYVHYANQWVRFDISDSGAVLLRQVFCI